MKDMLLAKNVTLILNVKPSLMEASAYLLCTDAELLSRAYTYAAHQSSDASADPAFDG